MTESDALELLSALFGSYVIGWGSGYLIYFFKKLTGYI
jgi:hypothetical protein